MSTSSVLTPFPPLRVPTLSLFRADALITGSWDRTVRFWDPRASNQQQSSHDLPERVYNMDLVNHILVVAMASRLFHIYDIRKMDSPAQTRESSLKFMTRALACMSDGQGMFLSSVSSHFSSSAPLPQLVHENPCIPAWLLSTMRRMLTHTSGRLCDRFSGRAYRSGVLRPESASAGEEVRVQVPSTDDRGCRPRLARERARVPPRVSLGPSPIRLLLSFPDPALPSFARFHG